VRSRVPGRSSEGQRSPQVLDQIAQRRPGVQLTATGAVLDPDVTASLGHPGI
jgi:hypothetical protein